MKRSIACTAREAVQNSGKAEAVAAGCVFLLLGSPYALAAHLCLGDGAWVTALALAKAAFDGVVTVIAALMLWIEADRLMSRLRSRTAERKAQKAAEVHGDGEAAEARCRELEAQGWTLRSTGQMFDGTKVRTYARAGKGKPERAAGKP